ncbi:DUF1343 domain-containing protein [Kitasatospora paranensis]|uniref:DUF1343 domain-containing protein n=1 Tax=Kitasatospora paranensis TaxID=258053 RepID=A0ABW2FXD1_9ACTN
MTAVRTGLDTLLRSGRPLFAGERVGLATHAAAVTADLRHGADALLAAGADLRALFGPEHGMRGTAPAGASEGERRDAGTGLPVHDTYLKEGPALAELVERAGIDVLLVDLQHVGVRFFTYESTLYDLIAATAATGTRLVVLDRPDPLGGHAVQGPPLDEAFSSFVGRTPLPLRHGMTMGELAPLFAERLGAPVPEVVPLEGWTGGVWQSTGLPWVPPSPNLPTPAAAHCYPGSCLFEGTNLSVGRGTATPFEFVGAPWLDGSLAAGLRALDLPGVRFREAWTSATADVHAGEPVCGVQWHVTDPDVFEPLTAAVELLALLLARWPERFAFRDRHFDLLAGGDRLRTDLLAGVSPQRITAAWTASAEQFAGHDRLPHLRYPRA